MTTSEPTSADPNSGAWFLELRPHLVHNARAVTEVVDALFQLMEEHEEKYVVTLEFDSNAHHQRGVELLGLLQSAGASWGDKEDSEVKGFEVQIVRLQRLLEQRLAWANANGKSKESGATLKEALVKPIRNLLRRTRTLSKSISDLRVESVPV